MPVYFLLDESSNRVKIGYSKNPTSRIRSIQTACSTPLKLIGVCESFSPSSEKQLHSHLAQYRANLEWFDYNAFVQDVISKCLGGQISFGEQEVEIQVSQQRRVKSKLPNSGSLDKLLDSILDNSHEMEIPKKLPRLFYDLSEYVDFAKAADIGLFRFLPSNLETEKPLNVRYQTIAAKRGEVLISSKEFFDIVMSELNTQAMRNRNAKRAIESVVAGLICSLDVYGSDDDDYEPVSPIFAKRICADETYVSLYIPVNVVDQINYDPAWMALMLFGDEYMCYLPDIIAVDGMNTHELDAWSLFGQAVCC